jgi:hypothetical protein
LIDEKKQEIKISYYCPCKVSSSVPEAGPPDVQCPLHVRLLLRQHPGGLPWDPAGSGNTKITAVGKIHRAFSQRGSPRLSTTVGSTDILYICTALRNIDNIVQSFLQFCNSAFLYVLYSRGPCERICSFFLFKEYVHTFTKCCKGLHCSLYF